MDSIITGRARHFGLGDRHGGWVFAADVACCALRLGRGRREPSANSGKISAQDFADRAGCDYTTVLSYLATWERAAGEGLVPPAATLTPDSEPELPPASRWLEFHLRQDRQPDREQARAQVRQLVPVPPPPPPPDPAAEQRRRNTGAIKGARRLLGDMARDGRGVVAFLEALTEPCHGKNAENIRADIAAVQAALDAARVAIGDGEVRQFRLIGGDKA
jgi:hypothetical protein